MKVKYDAILGTLRESDVADAPVIVVANYSALPDVTTVTGKFYWCSNSQGTKWLPGTWGGTYRQAGMYYSNGVSWEFTEVPYQATQAEVDAGVVTDKFVTPATLMNNPNVVNTPLITDTFVASDGQTIFTTSQTYSIPTVKVYLNGARLDPADYTATGTSVILAPCQTGDVINIDYNGSFASILTSDDIAQGYNHLFLTQDIMDLIYAGL